MPPVQSRLSGVYAQLPTTQYVIEQLVHRLKDHKGTLALLTAGIAGLGGLAFHEMASIRRKQAADRAQAKGQVSASAQAKGAKEQPKWKSASAVAVNSTFVQRLLYIFRIIVPGVFSKESLIILTQTLMLVARTLLSIRMAQLGGDGISAVVDRSWSQFAVCLTDFGCTGVIAAIVNSALKYLSNLLSIYFRQRLTRHVHEAYLRNRNYYKAAVLSHAVRSDAADAADAVQRDGKPRDSPAPAAATPGSSSKKLSNADARVTQDLNEFCNVFSDIYSRTFKPVLDMVICTHQLGSSLGYTGPVALYSYFILAGIALRIVMPPFPRLLAEQSQLESDFRRSHNRLITHAEEVAFLNGGPREKEILNNELAKITEHSQLTFFSYFRQGILDQFAMKYLASIVGWPVLAVPFLLAPPRPDNGHVVAEYRKNDALIQQSCSALHDLVMVYKKVQRLAGFTARVSELLEGMNEMNAPKATSPFDSTSTSSSSSTSFASNAAAAAAAAAPGTAALVETGSSRALAQTRGNMTLIPVADSEAESIEFNNVCVATPEGRLLVNDFTFKLNMHESMMVSGPNGAGKTSIFRTLAGLWPLASGSIVKRYHASAAPAIKARVGVDEDVSEIFYVPQNPYLVSGSLLEQVVYPFSVLEARVYYQSICKAKKDAAAASGATAAAAPVMTFEQKIMDCICIVGLRRFLLVPGSDELQVSSLQRRHHDWADVLSGGEKQRMGLARLFFHTPRFAVLDESTSAMNVDDEGPIYQRILDEGITVFSIAHRTQLRRFHKHELRLEGDGTGAWRVESITH